MQIKSNVYIIRNFKINLAVQLESKLIEPPIYIYQIYHFSRRKVIHNNRSFTPIKTMVAGDNDTIEVE